MYIYIYIKRRMSDRSKVYRRQYRRVKRQGRTISIFAKVGRKRIARRGSHARARACIEDRDRFPVADNGVP